MTVRFYRSSDFGAPVLSGTVNALVSVLDAILVTGYGSQSVTITRSGTTATVTTSSPHGLVKRAKYNIAGADQAEYNGAKDVTVTGANTLTFQVVGTPATPATGTITGGLAGAGWTKPFTGTNKAVFQQGAGSNGMYYRVDDAGTGSAAYARVVAYENMTGVDTGTNPFPTDTQVTGGCYFAKAITANAVARPWLAVASEKHFVFMLEPQGDAAWSTGQGVFFGDIVSYKPGDQFGTQFMCYNGAGVTSGGTMNHLKNSVNSTNPGDHYLARPHTQSGTSLNNGKVSQLSKLNGGNMGVAGAPYPDPVRNALLMAPVEVTEGATTIRGLLPGVWAPLHAKPLTTLDLFDGQGALAGKSFIAVSCYSQAQVFLEISDTF